MSVGDVEFTGWSASDWDDLRTIWAELLPEDEGEPASFRGVVLTAQQQGWIFERWVMEAFRLSGATIDYNLSNKKEGMAGRLEEIDGLVYDGWQGFLVEAKCERRKVGIDPVFRLHLMAEQRPVGTMGLIFSASGFSAATLELADRLRPIRVLLFDRSDLRWTMTGVGTMIQMVKRKWIAALKTGRTDLAVQRRTSLEGGSIADELAR